MKYEEDLWDLLRGFYPDELARWNKWSYQGGDRIVPPSHVHGHTRKASQQPVKRQGNPLSFLGFFFLKKIPGGEARGAGGSLHVLGQ